MSRLQTLLALTILCVSGGKGAAQHIALVKPGDVVAGKTLTGASNVAVSDTHRMVFRGTFEGNGGPQVGLFDYDLWTKAASVIASTENTFDGFTLSDLDQPFLSHSGKLLWRGVTDQGPAIFSEDGLLVKQGDPIAPGKVAVNPFAPLINDSGVQVFFDDGGAFAFPDSQVGEFPMVIGGKSIGLPTTAGASFGDQGVVTYVDSITSAIIGYSTTSGVGVIWADIGQVFVGEPFLQGFAGARDEAGHVAFVANLGDLRRLYMNGIIFATANDAVDDGQKLGAMNELRLTNSLEMFVGSEGRIVRITPEPTTLALALFGVLSAGVQVTQRLRR